MEDENDINNNPATLPDESASDTNNSAPPEQNSFTQSILEAFRNEEIRNTLSSIFAPQPRVMHNVSKRVGLALKGLNPEGHIDEAITMRGESIVKSIAENPDSDEWCEVIAKGLDYDNAVKRAYTKGRNEKVDIVTGDLTTPMDDYGRIKAAEAKTINLFQNLHTSVWDKGETYTNYQLNNLHQ